MFISFHFDENGNTFKTFADDKFKIVRRRVLDDMLTFKDDNGIPREVNPTNIEHWKHPKMTISLTDINSVRHYWVISQI